MVEKKDLQLPNVISEFLNRFLFPERPNNNYSRADMPARSLIAAHELLSKLANQIESHAAGAPYPQVAQALHNVATEKYASANKLKTIIETLGEKTRFLTGEPKPGKNHWDRLNQDLQDQIAVDDLLLKLELKAGENSETARIVKELRISQKSHQRVLSDLIAIADPQATQT
jgi:hypothetical protein